MGRPFLLFKMMKFFSCPLFPPPSLRPLLCLGIATHTHGTHFHSSLCSNAVLVLQPSCQDKTHVFHLAVDSCFHLGIISELCVNPGIITVVYAPEGPQKSRYELRSGMALTSKSLSHTFKQCSRGNFTFGRKDMQNCGVALCDRDNFPCQTCVK